MKRMLHSFAVFALLGACTGGSTGIATDPPDGGERPDSGPSLRFEDGGIRSVVVSDFSLPDVNATSATFGMAVSPRDYLQKVSGWYFGHAT